MTKQKTKEQPAPKRRERPDTTDPAVRQALTEEQAHTPIKEGYSAPWANSRFNLSEHSTPGCLPHEARAKYNQGDINALPDGCFFGHPLPKPPGYTRG